MTEPSNCSNFDQINNLSNQSLQLLFIGHISHGSGQSGHPYTTPSLFTWDLSYFFLKVFGGHESFLWGHWYPCFGLLVTSPLGFKARVGSALFKLSRGVCVTLHIPWDSLWRDTCQSLGSQHGSWAISSTYLQGIGWTPNQELLCRRWQCEIRQTLYRLSYTGSAKISHTWLTSVLWM